MSTGMIIDGLAATEAIDTSGEILRVDGCDISTLATEGLLNWEHRGDGDPEHTSMDNVGKIVYAHKIFDEKDCENDRQLQYYKRVELPCIYIQARLFDGAGHKAAEALAAQIRDMRANNEPILVRYSVEGTTLRTSKDKKELLESVIRRVSATVKPCNKSAVSGIVVDPNAPKGFEKNPDKVDEKDFLDDVLKRSEFCSPDLMPLGGSVEMECDPEIQETDFKKMKKALEAGNYNAAPGTLSGGAALQVEDPALKRRYMAQKARRALDTWKSDEKPLKQHLQDEMPEASHEFIDRFVDLIDKYKVGRKGSLLRMGNMGSRNITEIEKKERLIRKFERLDIALRKAAMEMQKPTPELPPAMEFGGRSVKPGLAQPSGGDLALLDATPDHLIGVPVDKVTGWHPGDLIKLPRVGEGEKFTVKRFPARLDERPVVDSALHGTKLNRHPFQHQLIEGLKLDKPGRREVERRHGKGSTVGGPMNDAHSFWYNQGNKHMYVKGFHASEETGGFHQHHKEMLFHNLAHEFFGLGDHVPATAHFLHPQTGESRLAVEKVDGHHIGTRPGPTTGMKIPMNPQDREQIQKLGDDGTLDKLAMMDMITGNSDRHDLNWLMGRDGKPKLIDHGHAFNGPLEPHYWEMYHNMQTEAGGKGRKGLMDWVNRPLHENAKSWLQSLRPEKLQQLLQEHNAPANISADTMDRLKHVQMAIARQPNITVFDAFHLPQLVAEQGTYPTAKSELEKAWPKDEAENQMNRGAHEIVQDFAQEQGAPTIAEGYKTVPYANPVKVVGRGSRSVGQGIASAARANREVAGQGNVYAPAASMPTLKEPTYPDTGPQRYRNVTEIDEPSDFMSPEQRAKMNAFWKQSPAAAMADSRGQDFDAARMNRDEIARENDKNFWKEAAGGSQLRPPHLPFVQTSGAPSVQDDALEWRFAPSQNRADNHFIASVQRAGDPGWRHGEYGFETGWEQPPHAHSAIFYLDPHTKTVDPAHPQNQHAIRSLAEGGYNTPEVLMNHLNDWAAGKLPSLPPVHQPAQSSAGDQFGPGGWNKQQAMLDWLKSPFNPDGQS